MGESSRERVREREELEETERSHPMEPTLYSDSNFRPSWICRLHQWLHRNSRTKIQIKIPAPVLLVMPAPNFPVCEVDLFQGGRNLES